MSPNTFFTDTFTLKNEIKSFDTLCIKDYLTNNYNNLKKIDTDIILLVGPPASFKSTISEIIFKDYHRINQDTLKTLPRCLKEYEQVLKENKKVIVDNTNPTKETRQKYITLANKYNKTYSIVFIDIPIDIILNINAYRAIINGRKIPNIAIYTFYKKLQLTSDNVVHIKKLPIMIEPDPLFYKWLI
jgi:predicted kinase